MKKQIREIQNLKDSSILYETNIPSFGYFIVMLISILCIITLLWSLFTPKIEMITSTGIVQSENKNYIMSAYVGEIISINIFEGKKVKKGENLITIKSTDINLQVEQLQAQKEIYEERVKMLKRLVEAIQTNKNLFSQDKEHSCNS